MSTAEWLNEFVFGELGYRILYLTGVIFAIPVTIIFQIAGVEHNIIAPIFFLLANAVFAATPIVRIIAWPFYMMLMIGELMVNPHGLADYLITGGPALVEYTQGWIRIVIPFLLAASSLIFLPIYNKNANILIGLVAFKYANDIIDNFKK